MLAYSATAQQTTNWTQVSPSIWESVTNDGLVRVECRVADGVTILGAETMGCTSAATYSDPAVFGSPSLEISASSLNDGNLNFHFFDALTGDPVYIVNPILHADKVGTISVVPLFSGTATANFNFLNGTWSELSSNGPIFRSTPNLFNLDDNSIILSLGGECINGTNLGTAGGSLEVNKVTESIQMSVEVIGGLLSILNASDEVEFVLSDLIIADPKIEVTKTAVENFSTPINVGNTVDYTIIVENTGNVTLDNIDLTDTFTDVNSNSLTLTNGPTFDSSSLGSAEGTLLPGETVTYLASFTLTTPVMDAGGVINQINSISDSPYGTDDVNDTSDDGIDTDGNVEDDPTISYFPTTEDDTAIVCEEDTIDINVLSNDNFGGNAPASGSIFIVTSASSGIAVVDNNGTPSTPTDDSISYTSATGYTGSDSFVYGIRDSKGYEQHATVTISEQAFPNAGADGTLTICEGTTVTEAELFAQIGTHDAGGTWSPAMGGAGTYTYTVAATSPCTVDDTAEVVVTEQPLPNAGTDGALTICEGTTVTEAELFAQIGTHDSSGTWSPAMGGAATYIYTVTATSPCTLDDTAEVIVTEQPLPNAGTDGALTICQGETVNETQLFNQLGGSPDSSGTWSPAMGGAGTYTYTVTATSPCTTDDTSEVVVTEQPLPNAGTDGTLTICEGTTVTEAELFAQIGTHDSGGTWSPAMGGAGTYIYTVAATPPCTVDDTAEVTVTEQPLPNAGTDSTLTICEGTTVTEFELFAQIGTHDSGGTWSPAMGGAGTYTYTVAATSPCTVDDTAEVLVTEQPLPNAGTDGMLTICEGTTVTEAELFAHIGTHDSGGTWSPTMGGAGTYTYTVAATSPCTVDDTAEVIVTEQPLPNAGTDGTLTICEGTTVTESQLFAQLGAPDSGGTWSPAMSGAGTYTYTLTATSPCTTDDTAEVIVTEQQLPNAGTDGTLTICEGTTVTEAELFAQIGTHDSGGTWSPAMAGAGTYTYTVAATSPCTVDDTAEVTVTEQPLPNAGTDGTLTICEGTTVTESELFAQIGTHDSGGTWSPTMGGAGTYTYTVAATSPCTIDDTSEVIVTEQPLPNAGTDGTLTVCEGTTVTEAELFAQIGTHDSGGTWSPAMGGAGTYTYTVEATSPCTVEATSPCTVDDTSEVVVTEQPLPNAGADGALTICEGTTVTESELFAQIGAHDAGGTWSPSMGGAGTYTYTVAATSPCTVDDTTEVTVTEQPLPNAGTDGALTICEGTTVTESELFAQLGSPNSGGTWSPAMGGAGTYTYTVAANSPCTVDDTAEVIVTEQPLPNAGTDGTLTICEGTTVTEAELFAQIETHDSGGTWSPAMGGAGTYTYTVTATSPCTTDDTSQVVVSEQPLPNAGTDGTLTICEGTTITEAELFAQIGAHDAGGTWSPAMSGAGTYTYTVTATSPCTTDDTSQVVVSEQPLPNAGTDGTLTICEGTTITEAELFAQIGAHDAGGTWSPAMGGAGTYTYTVTATSPCTTDDTSEVVVTEQPLPNAGADGALTICEGTTVTEAELFAQIGAHDSGGTWSPAMGGAGTYTYTVAATSPCTVDDTTEVTVTEQPLPNAGTDGALTICEGTTVTESELFAQLGSPNSGGTWSPAMGGAGTYTYTVAANSPCTVDDTAEVIVTEQPLPNAGTDGTLTICEGTTVTEAELFAQIETHDSGGTWSPAMGGAGTYTYTVTATSPCTTDDTSQVVVTEQPLPNAGTDGALTICEGTTVTESQLFAQLGSPNSGGTWSPAMGGAGTYTYTVAATSPCTVEDTAEVVVTEQPLPNAGTDGTLTICEGETVNETQLFNQLGGSPNSGGTWSPAMGGAGSYTYTVSSPVCESDTSTVTVTEEHQPNAGTDATLTICPNTTVTQSQLLSLLQTNDTRGTWNPNPEDANAGVYTYTIPGNICNGESTSTVTIILSNLDSDGDMILDCNEIIDGTDPFDDCDSINGTPLPISDCDNDNLSEEEETLLGTDPKNPDTDGDGVIDGQEVTDNTDPLDSCDFVIENQTLAPSRIWNMEDCDMDDLTNAQEIDRGTDPINPDTDGDLINDGQEVNDNTDPLDPCDSIGGTPPNTISCELFVELDIVRPGDILNGAFKIINIDRFPDNHVEIFNRWGILVWESSVYDNQNNAFDGLSKGRITIMENQKLPAGVYFYKIKYVSKGEDKMLDGYLYVIR
ncbi:gliding motility-associated C-terminal domain-containing protein [Zobellia alginiliquefaciens]|uniref:T9SS type B sorting domain-containing protein n=1 Tax=Zobellia alginiliquefaciens TaxID=3032586 RepID=UPI0023E44E20|nr:gliding motility-associated C-terminal domain-containing protein [Zobellia alginiliquefaciens]